VVDFDSEREMLMGTTSQRRRKIVSVSPPLPALNLAPPVEEMIFATAM